MNRIENASSRRLLRLGFSALLLFFVARFAAERLGLLSTEFVDPVSGLFLGVAIGTMIVALRRHRAPRP
ncbi:MAG: hypothetical protein AB7G12_04000 [Thermoanaerobaculia bacterium]